jgi:hypothetical protein
MAKGKHAAALFEVISRGNSMNQSSPRSTPRLGLPKWWTNRASRPREASVEGGVALMPSPPPRLRASTAPGAASHVAVDRQQRVLSFQLSYRAAALCGMGAVALLAGIFTIGQRMGRSPSPLLSLSSEELRAGPARPGVLEVNQAATAAAVESSAPPVRAASAGRALAEPAAPATHTVLDTKRSFGLNYVVVQSYLKPEDAQEARDLLIKNDIFCTVEKNLPHYGSKGWYSVVGLTGFDRIRGVREYQTYIASIKKVGGDYDAKHKGFKNFDPQPYKWR